MKCAVVGSNGFLARYLIPELQVAGLDISCHSSLDGSGIDPESGILSDSFSFEIGTSTVFYLAQSPSLGNLPASSAHVWAVNVLSALKAVEAARRVGAQKFIYVSSGTVYEPSFDLLDETATLNREDWYSLSKIQGEESVFTYKNYLDISIVRPFGLYGYGQVNRLIPTLIERVKQGQEIFLQDAEWEIADSRDGLRVSFCHAADAAKMLSDVAKLPGSCTVNLANSCQVSIREIAETIGQHLNIAPKFVVAENKRQADLLADITFLQGLVPIRERNFQKAIGVMLESD